MSHSKKMILWTWNTLTAYDRGLLIGDRGQVEEVKVEARLILFRSGLTVPEIVSYGGSL